MKTSGNGSHHAGDMESAARAVGGSAGALSQEFHNFVSDIEDLIKSSTSLSGDELAAARERIKERVAQARAVLGETGGNVLERARRTLAATNDYVADEPWKAIGVGAAVGFLLGLLVARRSA
jgi:ElaB/YqjD/DUF883 family membrane-anchored ribosome-binding protein